MSAKYAQRSNFDFTDGITLGPRVDGGSGGTGLNKLNFGAHSVASVFSDCATRTRNMGFTRGMIDTVAEPVLQRG